MRAKSTDRAVTAAKKAADTVVTKVESIDLRALRSEPKTKRLIQTARSQAAELQVTLDKITATIDITEH